MSQINVPSDRIVNNADLHTDNDNDKKYFIMDNMSILNCEYSPWFLYNYENVFRKIYNSFMRFSETLKNINETIPKRKQ